MGTMATRAAVLAVLLHTGAAAAFNFGDFKTCHDCIDAGFGWCPIQRRCGGFANQQCGTGERYWSEGYEAELKAKKPKDKDLPDVIPLAEDNFASMVVKPDGVWVVAFTNDEDESAAFAPEYAKAAKVLRGAAKCGRVDAENLDVASTYVTGTTVTYPHVVVFVDDKKVTPPKAYEGEKTAADLVRWVQGEVKALLERRTGVVIEDPVPEPEAEEVPPAETEEVAETTEEAAPVEEPKAQEPAADAASEGEAEAKKDKKKKKKKKKKGKKKKKADAEEQPRRFRPGSGEHVNGLDAEAFESLLKDGQQVALIHVYDEESEACSTIAEAFDEAATAVRGQALFYATPEKLGRFETGKVYVKTPGAEALAYTGDVTALGFGDAVAKVLPEVEVPELVDQATFDACLAHPLCGVVFVPALTESTAADRTVLLAKVRQAAGLARTEGRVMWAEAGSQPAIDHKFDIMSHTSFLLFRGKRRKATLHALPADTAAETIVGAFLSDAPPSTSYRPFTIVPRTQWDGKDFAYPASA